jgi:anthranilate phosphoribosyltransferase
VVAEKVTDFASGWNAAVELIDSGAALEKLDQFVKATNQG